ncbi:MAG: acyl-ACP--UDP-N-acetylglucosamine O-acyltransferase [Candidatus Omnitrophota bacterium]
MNIHPTAIIDKKAKLADGVEIGPYSTVGENVTIGRDTVIGAHCVIEGYATIGERCRIFTGAVIGSIPQDLKYKKGVKSFIKIGNDNIIREYITINPGTEEGASTVIGDKNELMAYVHIAHDCEIGNNVIIANLGTLAGYIKIEDRAVIGGMTAIHQFVHIGQLSITGGCSKIVQDILPYSMTDGNPARLYTINAVGLRRANMPIQTRNTLKKALKILQNEELSIPHAITLIEQEIKPQVPEVSTSSSLLKAPKGALLGNIKNGKDWFNCR